MKNLAKDEIILSNREVRNRASSIDGIPFNVKEFITELQEQEVQNV